MIATAPISVTLPARPLRVVPVAGEPTRFHCESESLLCAQCGHTIKWTEHTGVAVGDACPKCAGELCEHWYLVDIADLDRHGQCECPRFQFYCAPKVRELAVEERCRGRYRCKHLIACRDVALDVTLRAHQEMRGGQ